MAASRDDLPALGAPTRPASAISLSSRRRSRASPLRPRSAKSGACLIELLKWMLPRPPAPPRTWSRAESTKLGRWLRLGDWPEGGPTDFVIPALRAVSPRRGAQGAQLRLRDRAPQKLAYGSDAWARKTRRHFPAKP